MRTFKIIYLYIVIFCLLSTVVSCGSANWLVSHPVTYDANGALSGSVPSGSQVMYNDSITVAGNSGDLAISGSTFFGWNTDANGKGIAYKAGDELVMGSHAIILYAQWRAPPPPGSEKWKVQVQDVSSPAIAADGTLYISGDNGLDAINPDGTQKWHHRLSGGAEDTPAIGADGTVYVVSCKSLYAFTPDGEIKWRMQAAGVLHYTPAIGADGTLYVGEDSDSHAFYAINPDDGSKKWVFDTAYNIEGSASIAANGTIYVVSGANSGDNDGLLYAIKPDGTERWEHSCGGINALGSTPAIGSDGTVYVASGNGDGRGDNTFGVQIVAINPDGTQKWVYEFERFVMDINPVIGADGTIYIESLDDYVIALNSQGTKKWEFKTGYQVVATPAIAADGTVYVDSLDHNIYALDGATGKKEWNLDTGCDVATGPAIGIDGTVYVVSSGKILYALHGSSGPALKAPWPMLGQNNKRTGRVIKHTSKKSV